MSQKTVAALTGLCALFTTGALRAQDAGVTQRVPEAGAPADTLPATSGENPFADFETHFLSNGLKVWFKRLPDAPNVALTVGVPYGSDRDPPGREQLAHFAEHMLFMDHDDRTEEDIKEAVDRLGGLRNGVTYADRTFYYVTIAQEHGLFALEWLSRIVSPHAMDPEVVDRGRQPVALEINARPREFFEHIAAALNPAWLQPPNVWGREFGMETRSTTYDSWASLQRITPEDLRSFYDRYYAPGAMTLTIVGNLERDETLALAERTFGAFPVRTAPPQAYEVEDPGRGRATYDWGFRSDVRFDTRFKLYGHTAEDELHLLFIRDLLQRRLGQRLRYGERKAVYGIQVVIVKRGPAAYLRISGNINEVEYDYALRVIAEELEHLRAGSLDPAEFEEDRRALIERLRTANRTPESLAFLARTRFYDPNVFTDFPDVLGFYERVTQEELASFAAANLVERREFTFVTYVQPVSQGIFALAVILLVILTQRGVSWALLRPIEMRKIRYIARFRTPLTIRFVRVIVFAGLGLVLGRLFVALLLWVASAWVVTANSYVVQAGTYALMLSGSLALVVAYLSRFPRKLLVFPDHIRVKSWAYSSKALDRTDISEISLRRFKDVWLSRDIFGCTALTFGLLSPGLYIRPKRGRALFFRARDTSELMEVLEEWRSEPISTADTSEATRRVGDVAAPRATDRGHG